MNKSTLILSGVYLIQNIITNKVYVGSSINIEKRLKVHLKALQKRNHLNPYLQRAWNKYGEDNFQFKVLLYCEEKNRLLQEQLMIDSYRETHGLYNIYPYAGSPLGSHHSEETKRKQSKKKKEFWDNNEHPIGILNSFYGKVHSEETKKKISIKNKDKLKGNTHALGNKFFHTQEQLDKIHNYWNKENRLLHAEKIKGRIPWNKGLTYTVSNLQKERFPHTVETKLKMSENRKLFLQNPENKLKFIENVKKGWVNRKLNRMKKIKPIYIEMYRVKTIKRKAKVYF